MERDEKIIIRLLGHFVSLALLGIFIWIDIIKIGNLWALPLELFISIFISGITEVCIFTDYENFDERIKKLDIKRKMKQEHMMKKQQKKEKTTQERVTTYASYVEKKEALKKENNEMISDIERNIDSDFGRIKSRKNEYISLLELVEKYKKLERKQNIESSDNNSLDDIGYAYMKR